MIQWFSQDPAQPTTCTRVSLGILFPSLCNGTAHIPAWVTYHVLLMFPYIGTGRSRTPKIWSDFDTLSVHLFLFSSKANLSRSLEEDTAIAQYAWTGFRQSPQWRERVFPRLAGAVKTILGVSQSTCSLSPLNSQLRIPFLPLPLLVKSRSSPWTPQQLRQQMFDICLLTWDELNYVCKQEHK